jgi:hypothetical protein
VEVVTHAITILECHANPHGEGMSGSTRLRCERSFHTADGANILTYTQSERTPMMNDVDTICNYAVWGLSNKKFDMPSLHSA